MREAKCAQAGLVALALRTQVLVPENHARTWAAEAVGRRRLLDLEDVLLDNRLVNQQTQLLVSVLVVRVVQRALDGWERVALGLLVTGWLLGVPRDLPRARLHAYMAVGPRGGLGESGLLRALLLVCSMSVVVKLH